MPIIKETPYGEDRSIEDAPKLTEEDLEIINSRVKALDKVFAEEQKGKYKIELFFGSARSRDKPTPGALSFWESGAKLHGGGDAKIYICPGRRLRKNDCEAFIPDASTGYGHLVCPKCSTVWKGEDVTGEVFARLYMRGWANLLLKYFARLEHNCDIYIKHAKDDIRTKAELEQQKQKGGELLDKVRTDRAIYMYPLRNIIRDTSGGADLLGRFYALLTA